MKDLNQVKTQLDQIGQGFCLAKWTESEINLSAGWGHSCHHPLPHKIPLEEIKIDVSALHNKEQRKQMLSNNRPSECEYCNRIEENGNAISDRVITSAKPYNWPSFDKIIQSPWDTSYDPTSLQVMFSNVCNMSCAYCGPSLSSKWHSEVSKHGPYVNGYNSINEKHYKEGENPYVDAFWEYFPKIYPSLKKFKISGGEPLLSKHTDILLDFIRKNPHPELELTFNTNLTVDKNILNKFITKLQGLPVMRIVISTSGEGHSTRGEYVRDGTDYSTWLENCELILNSIPNVSFTIMSAYNCLAVTSYTKFLKDIVTLKKKYKKISVSVSHVLYPKFLEVSVLPKEFRSFMIETLDFIKNNLNDETCYNRFSQIITQYDNSTATLQQKQDLVKFIKEYDRRRGKDFTVVFPELVQMLQDYSKLS
jgi:hypothetical protein